MCALKDIVWKLKDQNKTSNITWDLHRRGRVYKLGDPMCYLCMDEKLAIKNCTDDKNNGNRDKMVMKPCDHKAKYKVTNVVDT